ncbi:MAG: hypothetical protein HOA15_08480 [Candidatus Marinimicrobia bacterium]|jgi:hypothetical protein|nr:hypothetical protein [Candidatus Neomarinimicrobiota bacterium]MBT3675356.1 hypothetical protein [Candidatus Neomarinimicrobiota bacterium]MBT3763837.1 hypothetical protein [Candidatus Neomarinimicrobiota bacterium]MBT4068488.1 hypothetical protein [Candidatus Neomarinimicrobiota bacterium]MBT4270130.1 hypothetical protein [Candidatus Neomarinimicrobiota bacterium]
MKSTTRLIFPVLFFFSILQSQSAAEAIHLLENEMGFGARSMGMGGGTTALGDDPSGMYWNPAGLTGIRNGMFYVETNNLNYNNNTTYINETSQNPIQKFGQFNGFGIVYPVPTVRGSMVIAIGYNRILNYDSFMSFSGFSLEDNTLDFPITVDGKEEYYPFSKNVQRSERAISSGGMEQLTFSFGIALSPTVSGGISISSITGREDYEFKFSQEDLQNSYVTFPADFKKYDLVQSLITKTKGWNIRGGLTGILNEWVRFGMALSLPYTMEVKENHGTDEVLIFDNGESSDANLSGYYDYKVRVPMIYDAGFAITIESLAISTSLRYKNWGNTQFKLNDLAADSEDYALLQEENSVLSFQYRSVMQLRVGIEYLWEFSDSFGITLRGGGGLIPSPDGESKVDQSYYTFGVGVPLGNSMIMDVAYIKSQWEKNSSDWYTPSGAIEVVHSGRLLVNFSYLF